MPATIILRNRQFEVAPGVTIRQALKTIGVEPEAVLVTRNGDLITEDELIREGDVILLIAVISGGSGSVESLDKILSTPLKGHNYR